MTRKNLIAGIWLIGLGLLFLFNFVWPGVLILIGLTMIVTALMQPEKQEMPPAVPAAAPVNEMSSIAAPVEAIEEPLPPALAERAEQLYNQSLLPETCPACGGPIKQNANQVVWEDGITAVCPFCANKLKVSQPSA